jgi:hypothetical protein
MDWANSRNRLKTRQDKYAFDQITFADEDDSDDEKHDENQVSGYTEGYTKLTICYDGETRRRFSDQGEEYFDY